MEARGVKVDLDTIKTTWFAIYRQGFLEKSLNKAFECKKGYWIYSRGVEGEVISIDAFKRFLFEEPCTSCQEIFFVDRL